MSGPPLIETPVKFTNPPRLVEKGTLTTAQRNALPDSAFAAVWTDAKGNKQRVCPIHDADHVRAALGGHGISATQGIPPDVKAKAKAKIAAAARKFGIGNY